MFGLLSVVFEVGLLVYVAWVICCVVIFTAKVDNEETSTESFKDFKHNLVLPWLGLKKLGERIVKYVQDYLDF